MHPKYQKVISLIIAIVAVFFLVLTGIAIGERSPSGAVLSLLASFFTVGYGFMLRKKWREQ